MSDQTNLTITNEQAEIIGREIGRAIGEKMKDWLSSQLFGIAYPENPSRAFSKIAKEHGEAMGKAMKEEK